MPQIRREYLLVVGLGFGSVLFSLTTFMMYREPPPSESKVVLAMRPPTTPRESLVRRSQRDGGPQIARAEVPAANKPAAVASETTVAGVSTGASGAMETAPAVVAARAPSPAEPKSVEEVRVVRARVWGEWQEVHDFRNGIIYKGKYHDFRGIEQSEPYPEGRRSGSR
ncbi:MAG: hypothetical protein AAB229_07490 [Candidatus Hydrogenedentota bacterium]